MIPKTIHYCWFGRGKMPLFAKKCMESWKKLLPDFEIRQWDERSFNIESSRYVSEAYQARKFAFVSDYVRLYALYHEGGIYMDTDVEVVKPLHVFLQLPAFTGFESTTGCITGIMGSEKGGKWVKDLLDAYEDRHFVREDGSTDMITNVEYTNLLMASKGLRFDNSKQDFPGYVTIFPKEFFCPKAWDTGQYEMTPDTHVIHHFLASWWTPRQRCIRWTRQNLGVKVGYYLAYFWRPPRVVIKALFAAAKRRICR